MTATAAQYHLLHSDAGLWAEVAKKLRACSEQLQGRDTEHARTKEVLADTCRVCATAVYQLQLATLPQVRTPTPHTCRCQLLQKHCGAQVLR